MHPTRNLRDPRWALAHGYDSDRHTRDRCDGVRALGKCERNGRKGRSLRDHRRDGARGLAWAAWAAPSEEA